MRKKLLIASTYLLVMTPLNVPNNRVGVHILETSEVKQAATLVNSNGGDWGYVTIVLRSNDLDRSKWINFFEDARKLHIIPIIRLATYPDGGTWVKPDALDLVDFANFLADMPWPVKNRYVILFNEVNHAAEWGGQISPSEYATLLLDSQRIFKERSVDFFLISAGLDMSQDALTLYRQMSQLQPKWYDAIDGVGIHAYPNDHGGITGFKYELELLQSLGYVPKPIFVTETSAFNQIRQDQNVVAITPFLLFAGSGEFTKFSLLNTDLSPRPGYTEIYNLPKVAGGPLLGDISIAIPVAFSSGNSYTSPPAGGWWQKLTIFWFRLLGRQGLTEGQAVFDVELAQTTAKREQGLSGRLTMPAGSGMLFVFDQPAQHTFWMKDMHYPLDFVWIRGGKVVEITKDVFPPRTITPEVIVDQVLEINAGEVDKYGIKVGDIVGGDKN